MVNYVTPGYATAVFVSAGGVGRIRTTAESHRRIAIIEVMGRHSGYIALGSAYGRPDIILVPEHPLNIEHLVERVKDLYDLQKNVVIVCGEGIFDEQAIFTDAIGDDDMEHIRRTLFAVANLAQPYHSINTDVNKRIRYLQEGNSEPIRAH